jgi:hypothetical protein
MPGEIMEEKDRVSEKARKSPKRPKKPESTGVEPESVSEALSEKKRPEKGEWTCI